VQASRQRRASLLSVAARAPILPLAVGAAAYLKTLGTPHQATFERGLELAAQGDQ
jgi:hypothetical protein